MKNFNTEDQCIFIFLSLLDIHFLSPLFRKLKTKAYSQPFHYLHFVFLIKSFVLLAREYLSIFYLFEDSQFSYTRLQCDQSNSRITKTGQKYER